MIEAIGGIGHAALAQSAARPAIEEQEVALQQPTGAEAADFARAATMTPPMLETAAMPPTAGNGLSARLAEQADALSAHLQALGPAPAVSEAASPTEVTPPPSKGSSLAQGRNQMNEAVAQIEQAYMFAIETTMASRGSTETTKIFNTLLKGQ